MNQNDLEGIAEAVLLALSDPPGKSKHHAGLAGLTGLEKTQVEAIIEELKRKWEVSNITPPPVE